MTRSLLLVAGLLLTLCALGASVADAACSCSPEAPTVCSATWYGGPAGTYPNGPYTCNGGDPTACFQAYYSEGLWHYVPLFPVENSYYQWQSAHWVQPYGTNCNPLVVPAMAKPWTPQNIAAARANMVRYQKQLEDLRRWLAFAKGSPEPRIRATIMFTEKLIVALTELLVIAYNTIQDPPNPNYQSIPPLCTSVAGTVVLEPELTQAQIDAGNAWLAKSAAVQNLLCQLQQTQDNVSGAVLAADQAWAMTLATAYDQVKAQAVTAGLEEIAARAGFSAFTEPWAIPAGCPENYAPPRELIEAVQSGVNATVAGATALALTSPGCLPATTFPLTVQEGESDALGFYDALTQQSMVAAITAGFAPQITVTSPNGGEVWALQSARTITWNAANVTGNVKIWLSRNAGSTWTTIVASAPNTGSFAWTVTTPITAQALVRVSSVSLPTVLDVSDGVFQIGGGSITVTAPAAGALWPIGGPKTITWTSSGFPQNVKIELSRNNGSTWANIVGTTANTGTYTWASVTGPATTQARVRISSVLDPTVTALNAGPFSIGGGAITVVSPNGGESWQVATLHVITWTSVGVPGNVKIEIQRDGGVWKVIKSSILNDGNQSWKVILPIAAAAIVRITSVDDPSVSDTSNAPFVIHQ